MKLQVTVREKTHKFGIIIRENAEIDNLRIKAPLKLHRQLVDIIASYARLVYTCMDKG